MKKIWKALGIAALAAAVPVRIKKNEETGKTTYQSLLLSVDVGPNSDGEGTDIGVNIGEGLINSVIAGAVTARKEADLFTDDPDEAVLFADDDPAAAIVTEAAAPGPAPEVEEAPQAEEPAADLSDPVVTEEDFDPDL